jgi:hypothetical protein
VWNGVVTLRDAEAEEEDEDDAEPPRSGLCALEDAVEAPPCVEGSGEAKPDWDVGTSVVSRGCNDGAALTLASVGMTWSSYELDSWRRTGSDVTDKWALELELDDEEEEDVEETPPVEENPLIPEAEAPLPLDPSEAPPAPPPFAPTLESARSTSSIAPSRAAAKSASAASWEDNPEPDPELELEPVVPDAVTMMVASVDMWRCGSERPAMTSRSTM